MLGFWISDLLVFFFLISIVFKSSGFLIFWFYQFQTLRFSDGRRFWFLEFRVFWFSHFQVSRFSDSLHFKFWIVRFSDFTIFKRSCFSDFQNFRLSDFLILGFGDIQIFGFASGPSPRYPPFQCWRIIKYSRSLLAGVSRNQQHWTWACKGGWKGKMLSNGWWANAEGFRNINGSRHFPSSMVSTRDILRSSTTERAAEATNSQSITGLSSEEIL